MITITAIMKAKEGKSTELAEEIKKYAFRFPSEPGCIHYQVLQRVDNPHFILFFEQYRDNEAIQYHSSSSNFKEMLKTIEPYLDTGFKTEIMMYKDI